MLKTIDDLKKEGWEILVNKLGAAEATRYILQFQKGHGDYTRHRRASFEGVSAEEIIKDIKKRQK